MRKILSIVILLCLASLASKISLAQTFTISGRVFSNQGPLAGVSVILSGLNTGTSSSGSGNFLLSNIPNGNYVLNFSSVGYLSQKVDVTVRSSDVVLPDIILQQDIFKLEQVVVTATRNEVLRKDAPIVCNVLDDQILKATQSITLSEGLSFQPALRIENNCQNCGFNSLRMNGLEGAYSQILIDGRPVYNSLQGVYGLEQIPSNMIERVEVVRSGGSALYGSSAVAGTVNIITKEPIKNTYYVSTNHALIGGSAPDKTFMLGADVVNQNRDAGLSINGFNRNRDFWDSNNDGYSEIGQLKGTSLSGKAYYRPSKLSKITVNGFSIYENRRGGNKFDKLYHEADITEATTHNILSGGITYEQYTNNERHKFSFYANALNLKRDSYYGGGQDINAYGNSVDNTFISGIQYSGKLGRFAGGSHLFISGLEINRNNLSDNAPAYDRFINQTANQLGVYAQDLWQLGKKINILLGARVDKHNLVGKPIISPRTNILYKINPTTQFRVGYARGFRAPQVFDEDLHITQVGGGGAVIRNISGLTPEYSHAFSSSVDFNKYYNDWAFGFTVDGFYTQLNNVFILEEVGTNANGDLLLERRNGEGATVAGITLNPKFRYKNNLSAQVGFTIQQSNYQTPVQWSETVENTSRRFFRTPNNYGFYVITYDATKDFTINLSGIYTGSMLAQHYAGYIDNDVLETTPAFFENNFKLDYNINIKQALKVQLSGGIQNYTNSFQRDFDLGPNRDAAYIYGPSRPRTFFIGTNFKF